MKEIIWSENKPIPFSVRYGCISREDGVFYYSIVDIANNMGDQIPPYRKERVVSADEVLKIKESYTKKGLDLLAIY